MTNHYSVSDLETRATAIISQARTTKEPIYVSQNGHAAVVLVDAESYLNDRAALREFERIFRDESHIRPARKVDEGEAARPKYVWRCTVCGYTVESDDLPEAFQCPVCHVGKDQFERIEL